MQNDNAHLPHNEKIVLKIRFPFKKLNILIGIFLIVFNCINDIGKKIIKRTNTLYSSRMRRNMRSEN